MDFDDYFDDDKAFDRAFGPEPELREEIRKHYGSRTSGRIAAAGFVCLPIMGMPLADGPIGAVMLWLAFGSWCVFLAIFFSRAGFRRTLWHPFRMFSLLQWVMLGPPVGEGRVAWSAYLVLLAGFAAFLLVLLLGAAFGASPAP